MEGIYQTTTGIKYQAIAGIENENNEVFIRDKGVQSQNKQDITMNDLEQKVINYI